MRCDLRLAGERHQHPTHFSPHLSSDDQVRQTFLSSGLCGRPSAIINTEMGLHLDSTNSYRRRDPANSRSGELDYICLIGALLRLI